MKEKKREYEFIVNPNTFNLVLRNYRTGETIDLEYDSFEMFQGNRNKMAMWQMVHMIEAGE